MRVIPSATWMSALALGAVAVACAAAPVTEPDLDNEVQEPPASTSLLSHNEFVAFLPPNVAQYKAVVVFLPGLRDPATGKSLDSRGLVRGQTDGLCSIWCSETERAQVRNRALELLGGEVALVGTTTLLPEEAHFASLITALAEFGKKGAHAELATVPIVFVGHSMGGCAAYGFSRVHGARVAGFITMKGACHNTGPALAAAQVPGYFLIGEYDAPYRRDNIMQVYEAGRAAGAPWTVATDALGHEPMMDFDLMFEWIGGVLQARLAAGSSGAAGGSP